MRRAIFFLLLCNIYLGEDGNMDDTKKAKLIVSPKENAARYGDLIESEEFSIEETNDEE